MAAGPVRELFGRGQLGKTEDEYASEPDDVTTTDVITLVHPFQGSRAESMRNCRKKCHFAMNIVILIRQFRGVYFSNATSRPHRRQ